MWGQPEGGTVGTLLPRCTLVPLSYYYGITNCYHPIEKEVLVGITSSGVP